jgi:triosephosphate isomerase (TIM)
MPRKIIIANWKMNLSVNQSLEFLKKVTKTNNPVVIAAPYTFLCELRRHLAGKQIKLAGQNVSQFDQGAYTGDISAKMLKEEACSYCLVGHSERRIYFKETDKEINKKIKQLLQSKIKPVLCIGENLAERQKKLTMNVLGKQLKTDLKGLKFNSEIIVAYEPVWAISTFQKGKVKRSATVEDIIAAHKQIRKILKKLFGQRQPVKILYGGTVNPQNSRVILSQKEVDGVLIGGASLKASSLNAIIKAI